MAANTHKSVEFLMEINIGNGRLVKVALKELSSVEWVKSHMVDVVSTLVAHFPPGTGIPADPVYLSIPQDTSASTTAVSGQTEGGSEATRQTEGGTKTSHSVATAVRHEWTSNQTRQLIALVDQRLERLKTTRNKQRIWMEIAEELNCDSITGIKCEDKWKNLKKAYRDYVQKTNCTGTAPSRFEFATEMGKVLGTDPSVQPKFTIDSEATMTMETGGDTEDTEEDEEIYLERACTANAGASGQEKASSRKRKRSSTGMQEMIAYLEERNNKMMEQLNNMHTENMKVMNKIADKL